MREIASIRQEVVVDRSPDRVWDVLRDVGAVHRRLLPGRVQEVSVDGNVRTLTMPDGHVVRELIIDVDDDARRLAYAVVEGARPPLQHHHATFQVFPEGDERSRLVWVTDILPDTLADLVRERSFRGAAEMKRVIEAAE
ncbi:SRPBCC family protein [Dactylosporangium sp. NPDC051484]|uniref:SRPBCC family protein n=1 Tax=Dactylosporangium sp. NPDC051484 TaxID=3154942 RepID=UPI00345011F4